MLDGLLNSMSCRDLSGLFIDGVSLDFFFASEFAAVSPDVSLNLSQRSDSR